MQSFRVLLSRRGKAFVPVSRKKIGRKAVIYAFVVRPAYLQTYAEDKSSVADVRVDFGFSSDNVYHAARGYEIHVYAERGQYGSYHLARDINIYDRVVHRYAAEKGYYIYRRAALGRIFGVFGFFRGLGVGRSLVSRRIQQVFEQLVQIRVFDTVYSLVDCVFDNSDYTRIAQKETAEIGDRDDYRLAGSACAYENVPFSLSKDNGIFSPFGIERDEKFYRAALDIDVYVRIGQPLFYKLFYERAQIRLFVRTDVYRRADRHLSDRAEKRFYNVGLRVLKTRRSRSYIVFNLFAQSVCAQAQTVALNSQRKSETESVVALACRQRSVRIDFESVAVQRSRKLYVKPVGQRELNSERVEKRGYRSKSEIYFKRVGIDDYFAALCRKFGSKAERSRRSVRIEPSQSLLFRASEKTRNVEYEIFIQTRHKRIYYRRYIYFRFERGQIHPEQREAGKIYISRSVLGKIYGYELTCGHSRVRADIEIPFERQYHLCAQFVS